MALLTDVLGLQVFEVTYFIVLGLVPIALFWCHLVILGLLLSVLSGCYYIVKNSAPKRVNIEKLGVLITGCDTGFGHVLARRLDDMGITVYAGCLQEKSALQNRKSKRLHVIQLDVTNDVSVSNALSYVSSHVAKTKSGLWGIVNNAGLNFIGDIEFCTMEMYNRVMEVNLFGMVRVTKAFLPLVRKTKGRIVNVTSVQGRLPMPSHSTYGVTKFGGENFSDVLRLEMIKFGVKVSLIEPGNFGGATGMLNDASLRRIRRDFDTMWTEACEDARQTYGKEYLETQYTNATKISASSAQSLDTVMDAFEDALLSERPKTRYLIGGGIKLVDEYCMLAKLRDVLPTAVMDFLIDKIFASGVPIKRS